MMRWLMVLGWIAAGICTQVPIKVLAQTPPSSRIWTVNRGDTISIHPGTLVSITGSFWNRPGGAVYNRDTIYLTDTLLSEGGNTLFQQQLPGTVVLRGPEQIIAGTDPVEFHTLRLRGLGAKRLDQPIDVTDTLDLGARMLDTRVHTCHVRTGFVDAIRRTEGFVRSDSGGWLWRLLVPGGTYLFPVGDSLPGFRYRPVELTAVSLSPYEVRMVNRDPNTDGLWRDRRDTGLCAINPFYYHRIRPVSGTPATDIRIYYDRLADAGGDRIAHWAFPAPGFWRNLGGVQGNTTPLASVQVDAHSNFNTDAFALGRMKPEPYFDPLPPRICRGAPPLQFTGLNPPTRGYFTANGRRLPGYFLVADSFPDGLVQITFVNPDTFLGEVLCPDSVTRFIEIYTPPPAGLRANAGGICRDGNLLLTASPAGERYRWLWNGTPQPPDSTADSTLLVTEPGTWQVVVYYACGAVDTSPPLNLVRYERPTAAFGYAPDSANIFSPIQFTDQSTPASPAPDDRLVGWFWAFGDSSFSTAQNPAHSWQRPGAYTVRLVVTSAVGCADTAEQVVNIYDRFELFIPNVFTPNGDGQQDRFQPTGEGFAEYNLQVFDRWGRRMWQGTSITQSWDGNAPGGAPAPEGTYFYQLRLRGYGPGRTTTRQGSLTLLR
jgi:gliding motility-associated-like protein